MPFPLKFSANVKAPVDGNTIMIPDATKIQRKKTALLSNLDVSDYILLTLDDLEDSQHVLITFSKMLGEQETIALAETLMLGDILRNYCFFNKAKREYHFEKLTKTNRSPWLENYKQRCCKRAIMKNHLDIVTAATVPFLLPLLLLAIQVCRIIRNFTWQLHVCQGPLQFLVTYKVHGDLCRSHAAEILHCWFLSPF